MRADDAFRIRGPIVCMLDRGATIRTGDDVRRGPLVLLNRRGAQIGMLGVR